MLTKHAPVKRVSLLATVISLLFGGAVACDYYWRVVTTAPLARPLHATCIRSAFQTFGQPRRIESGQSQAPRKGVRATSFAVGFPYLALS